jgi:hypothetical protein
MPSNVRPSQPIKFNIYRCRFCLFLVSIVLFFGVFHTSSVWKNNHFYFIIMAELKIQDENNVATEQNSMVQRISLEVKRRKPSSVSDIFLMNIY